MILAVNTTLQLLQLRSLMLNLTIIGGDQGLAGYIVPLADAHSGERIAPCDQRLKFISGFTGSAGFALITHDAALLWTDGRYFTQAVEQLDENWQLQRDGIPGTPSVGEYLAQNLPPGSLVGVDPALYAKSKWDTLTGALKAGRQNLVPVELNLVDLAWGDHPDEIRPACPTSPIFELEINFTGKNTTQKLVEIRDAMKSENVEAIVLSELDEIAWLLNVRGSDLPSASVFISYLIILEDKFQFFIDPVKITDPILRQSLISDGCEFHNYGEVTHQLDLLVNSTSRNIWFSNKCNYALVRRVPATRQIVKLTPLAMMKAVKNHVEVEGMKSALIRDAAAVSRFLQWVEDAVVNKEENVTELSAAARLLEFRKLGDLFLDTSFTTISAAGANGAIIHYRPSEESNALLTKNDMYLCDSGAIYRDGTTDITRTLHFGTPTDLQMEAYTRVLKGQIAIVTTTFPMKLYGSRIDTFARRALWKLGLDYNHGTGHGIGHALNVHEGPTAVQSRYIPDDQGFRESMFTSNEPGYYEEGEFGIRLENVILVVNVTLPYNFQNQGFLGFEDLVFVPYQRKLIKEELLTSEEINYLNDYQEKCRTIVGGLIREQNPTDPAYDWIIQQTQPFQLSK